MSADALTFALAFAKNGWPVFPCIPRDKKPLTSNGFKDASRDPDVIRAWWQRWPDANLGIPTGESSGLLVIDLDKKPDANGEASFSAFAEKHGPIPETARQRTGGGGSQLLFRYPSGTPIKNSAGKLGAGIDVRGEGGYIVAPPSIHPNGQAYRWERKPSQGIAEPPGWLLDLLAAPEEPHKADRSMGKKKATLTKGRRNDGLFRLAASLRAKDLGEEAIRAALREENWARCTPPLPEEEVDAIAASAARYPESEDGEGDTALSAYRPPWPTLHEAALYGLAGDVVRMFEPHTEADRCALLFQFHAGIGSVIGRAPYFQVEGDGHHVNLDTVLVGDTAKGRKGTSWGQIRRLLAEVDPTWAAERCASGLSSGEGLKYNVRDARMERKPVKDKGRTIDYEEVEVDAGVRDKRLLVIEGEFARALRVIERDGNTLSDVIRMAWDTGNLRDLVKHDPIVSTGAHISIIGHITRQELLRYLSSTEAGNGFANRFLWVCVRRSKELPEGGDLHTVDQGPLLRRLGEAVRFARSVGEVKRDADARAMWCAAYHELSASQPGLLGTVTARGEAQVVRLSLLYALLDLSPVIRQKHLLAALAAWKYAEDSAAHIFGAATGDRVADRIEAALRESPEGLTREELRQLFNRNEKSERIGQALDVLREAGRVVGIVEKDTGGRPAERWVHSRNEKATR